MLLVQTAQVPFADVRGGVAGLLEQLRQCVDAARQMGFVIAEMLADVKPQRVTSGEDGSACRRADGGRRIELRQLDATGRQGIQVRRLDRLAPETGEVRITQIIGEDEDNVGLGGLR